MSYPLALTAALGCGAKEETRIEPSPALVAHELSEATREGLEPGWRTILEKIEDGSLVGADASPYQATLETATKVDNSSKLISYTLSIDGTLGDLEGHAILFVRVQKKFNHVIHCGIAVPRN